MDRHATRILVLIFFLLCTQGCSIRTLEGDLIHYQEIRFLDLEHNDIQGEQADFHVLHSLPNLVTLNLQYNRIQALDDFSPNKNLQLLELDNNEIQSLAGFRHPNLFALTLSKNNVSGFKGIFFVSVPRASFARFR